MKVTITPADIRTCNECLSQLAASDQWLDIVEAGGIDVTDERDQNAANRRIAQGMLTKMESIRDEPL